jgi:hypothetical protein
MRKRKIKREPFNVRDGRAYFEVLKASEGGASFTFLKCMLEEGGMTEVRRAPSIFVGHYGFSVPAKFNRKTSRLVFGKY